MSNNQSNSLWDHFSNAAGALYDGGVNLFAWGIDRVTNDDMFLDRDGNPILHQIADAGPAIYNSIRNGNIMEGLGRTANTLMQSGLSLGQNFMTAALDIQTPADLLTRLVGGLGGFFLGSKMGGTMVGLLAGSIAMLAVPRITDHFSQAASRNVENGSTPEVTRASVIPAPMTP